MVVLAERDDIYRYLRKINQARYGEQIVIDSPISSVKMMKQLYDAIGQYPDGAVSLYLPHYRSSLQCQTLACGQRCVISRQMGRERRVN